MSNLVIVESPAKAKTIGKYLGRGFIVVASVGHIRDLPKSKLGVEIDNDFTPLYENKKEKAALIKELKEKAGKAKTVYLATDPDREGEAISWHLANILELDLSEPMRITFNEITESGVRNGMDSPRIIKMDLVNAQQARRILDRIVGYKLSPFLWKKVRRGLSAGRVQSVAVRIIVDREKEIALFKEKEYWSIDALFSTGKGGKKKTFPAKLTSISGKKVEIENKAEADSILASLQNAVYKISSVKKSERQRQPAPPFTTSTLQQEASNKLSFNAKRTMKAAQELYEGIETKAFGLVGLITYMRTDSLRISDEARDSAKEVILSRFGERYLPEKPRVFKQKSSSQDAHEAVRPSVPDIAPEKIKESLTGDQYKLYKLIWERFMASQMSNAVLDTVSMEISAPIDTGIAVFKATGYTVKFDGFTKLYEEHLAVNVSGEDGGNPGVPEKAAKLPEFAKGDDPGLPELSGNQHFTQPPPRYTEATLIKALEENGIGRPSTYAPTIATIMDRNYVEREGKQLKPTTIGNTVTTLLQEHFESIVDPNFTADMENDLDKIADGDEKWVDVLKHFYGGFETALTKAEKDLDGKRIKIPDEPTDEKCELCGRDMVIKIGKYGRFLSCSGFPECKCTKKIVNDTGGICPKCGGRMLSKKSKKGKVFFGCENYQDCGFMTWDTPVADKCPKCGSTLFKKGGKKGKLLCEKPDCGYEIDITDMPGKE
ncbi:DNA topoisomerase 1 [Clostridia bacterium]|nr:DNA topoisomerase 1 [Clostridia bacterium]